MTPGIKTNTATRSKFAVMLNDVVVLVPMLAPLSSHLAKVLIPAIGGATATTGVLFV